MKKVCIYIQITYFKRWAEFCCLGGLLKILVKTSLWDLNQNTRYSTYIFFPSHPLFVHKKMQEGTYLVWKCSIDTLFHSLLKKPELSVNSHPSLRWPEAISLKTSQGATLQIGRKHKYEFCMRGDVGWTFTIGCKSTRDSTKIMFRSNNYLIFIFLREK